MAKLKKFDTSKNRVDLLPVRALWEIARVFSHGARKYRNYNWMQGTIWSRYYGAALRHMYAYWGKKDNDEESKMLHLAHAGCCIMILLVFQLLGIGKDDRP